MFLNEMKKSTDSSTNTNQEKSQLDQILLLQEFGSVTDRNQAQKCSMNLTRSP